jgi:hypothetical protein
VKPRRLPSHIAKAARHWQVILTNHILAEFCEENQKMSRQAIKRVFMALLIIALVVVPILALFPKSGAAYSYDVPRMLGMESGAQEIAPLNGPPTSDISAPIFETHGKGVSFDRDLRELPQTGHTEKRPIREMGSPFDPSASVIQPDGALQTDYSSTLSMPAPSNGNGFAGLDLQTYGAGWPPDTHGAVGPSHYIQAVNTSMAIYDKTTGNRLTALTMNNFMGGVAGSACDAYNQGDPIVLYDHYSGRWIVTDFAWKSTRGPFYECIAVSKNTDPVSGGWWFYQVEVSTNELGDYPKLGVWPDGIYMGASMFKSARTYSGAKVWVFNREDLINGAALRSVSFKLGTSYFSVFPSTTAPFGGDPAAGTPNYFFSDYGVTNAVRMWKFTTNWTTPANSSFTGPTSIATAAFSKPSARVPQKGSSETLDTLGDRLMSNFEYRNIGGVPSLWLTRTVVNSPSTGIRWMEIRNLGATPSVYQQGTFAPDANYRWMPSLAVDKQGNMAVGYSVSSSTMFPAIRYAGRLATDALGTLGQGEASLIEGTGSQSGGYNRWGDYASMTIDPIDGCTFWFTTEYYITTSNNWQTRIGSFKFPGCQ